MRLDDQLTPDDFAADGAADLGLAVRRHTDRCFFAAEELVAHPDGSFRGVIVAGHLIDADDLAEIRRTPADRSPGCGTFPSDLDAAL